MIKLDELVPPLDLCQRIPPEAFADSALVRARIFTGHIVVVPREAAIENDWDILCSAPTLKEILKALPSQNRDKLPLCITPDFPDDGPGEFGDAWACGYRKYGCIIETAPETAALKLWLSLNAKEQK